jgi:Fur family ferric uptake transcriptional regulator
MESSYTEQLRHKNVKPTAMRLLVLKVLGEQKAAIGLPDLEAEFDRADRVTLYRTLKTFKENKLIHCIDDGTGSVKYALCKETCQCSPEDLHLHFFCTGCHQTFCLKDIPLPGVNLPRNFTFESAGMVVKGICDACNK